MKKYKIKPTRTIEFKPIIIMAENDKEAEEKLSELTKKEGFIENSFKKKVKTNDGFCYENKDS